MTPLSGAAGWRGPLVPLAGWLQLATRKKMANSPKMSLERSKPSLLGSNVRQTALRSSIRVNHLLARGGGRKRQPDLEVPVLRPEAKR